MPHKVSATFKVTVKGIAIHISWTQQQKISLKMPNVRASFVSINSRKITLQASVAVPGICRESRGPLIFRGK